LRKERRQSVRRQSTVKQPNPRPIATGAEQEILYSGSEYETVHEDSEDDGGGARKAERGSVLFEMLYAHTQQPQQQLQKPVSDMKERREKRKSIMPKDKGTEAKSSIAEEEEKFYSDSEYETDYVISDDDEVVAEPQVVGGLKKGSTWT
jgi:hypothetical protein